MKTYALNRAALTVIPKQPYIDWANTLDTHGPRLNVDESHLEYTIYLIEEVHIAGDVAKALKRHYAHIFEQELAAWHTDERAWPQKRDLRMFKKWFDIKVSSVVIDLANLHFELEEFDAETW